MRDFAKIATAGPLFFLSSWFLMLFEGVTHKDLGIRPIGYETAMIITIGLWLTMVPAIGAVARRGNKSRLDRIKHH